MSTTRMQWMAVRCCCTPTKILGFLRLPVGHREWRVSDWQGRIHRVEIKPISSARASGPGDEDVDVAVESAVYSEDRGIEFWRSITGFLEVSSPVARHERRFDILHHEFQRDQ